MWTSLALQRVLIGLFAVVNGAMLYLFFLQLPYSAQALLASFRYWERLGPHAGLSLTLAGAVIVVALSLRALLSPACKDRLVYWEARYAHPGHRAFLGGKNPGFDLDPLDSAYPQVRDSAFAPEVQFQVWNQLCDKHRQVSVVRGARETWCLLRGLYTMSVVFLAAFLVAWPLNGTLFVIAASYLFVFGAQTLFLLFSARRIGWRLVNNVLGVELESIAAQPSPAHRGKRKRK